MSESGSDRRFWVCKDCDSTALEHFKIESVAEQHAERTGHEVVERRVCTDGGTDSTGTEQSEVEETPTECYHCEEPVDPAEPGVYKTVSDQFWHPDCIAEYCYERRELVATPEGSFKIKSVVIKEIEDGQDKVLDSFWRADCPVCYQTHESEERTEEVRSELVDEVVACCDIEWLPPADWIEDCDICGAGHREKSGCKPITHREPFPHFSEHRFDCAECEWSGEGEDLDPPVGECPECGTAAVRAVKVATDGSGERYAYSMLTDTWYRVTEWDDLGDGKIQAKSKEKVPREEVPQEWLDATEERGDRHA